MTMTKSKTGKSAKSAADKLAKTGKKSGVALTEAELGQVSGGLKQKGG
jgi:hypothetical protein